MKCLKWNESHLSVFSVFLTITRNYEDSFPCLFLILDTVNPTWPFSHLGFGILNIELYCTWPTDGNGLRKINYFCEKPCSKHSVSITSN